MALSKTLAIALLLSAKTNKASEQINRFASNADKRLKALNERASNLFSKGSNNIKAGAAMLLPIGAAVKMAADLEDKIADVAKVVDVDFGSKGFVALEKTAMRVGENLGRSSSETAALMAELAAGGIAKENLEAVATAAGKVGVAFDVSAGEAGKAYMVIQNAMNLTGEETMAVMNAMNAATNTYGGKASELLNFMAQGAASVATTLKVSGVEMQAFGNAFQVVGISSSEAATTMTRFQKAILTNAKAAEVFNKAGGGSAGMLAILEKAKASGNAAKWLLKHGFGEYSTKLAQLSNNLDSDKGVRAQLQYLQDPDNIEGSAEAEFLNRQKTTTEQFNKMKVSAANAAVTLGSTLLPVLSDLMKQLKPIIERVSTWIGENRELTGNILKAVAGFAVARIALGGLQIGFGGLLKTIGGFQTAFKFISMFTGGMKKMYLTFQLARQFNKFAGVASKGAKVLGMLRKAFLGVGKAVIWIGRMLIANPIILAITAIAVGVYLIIKHWDKIKVFFTKLWNRVRAITTSAWEGIKNYFINLWESVKAIFSGAWAFIEQLFNLYNPASLIIRHWDKVSGFFSGLWAGIKKEFLDFIEFFASKWRWVNDHIIKPATRFFTGGSGNDINVNHASGTPLPQPVPVRVNDSSKITFNPVINVQGSMDHRTSQSVTAQLRRDFEKQMADYNHNRNRRNIG